MVFKMAPSGLTNNFLTDVSKWNTEVLLGSEGLLEEMAETKDVLAKRVPGGDLITEVNDTVGIGGGTETLAVVFMICGVACTVGRELAFPREFTIFVEFLRDCFTGCPLKELFDASVIFWAGLSTGLG